MYLLGEHAGLYVADGTSAILNALGFGISTDYALLLLARYREELRPSEKGMVKGVLFLVECIVLLSRDRGR